MKYWIQLYARMNAVYSVNDKHRNVIIKLQNISNDWGIKPEVSQDPPSFGTDPTAVYSLYRKFNSNSIKGTIMYSYRGQDNDRHSSDDSLVIEFDDRKVDIELLMKDAIYRYVDIFDAYRMDMFPEDLIYQLADLPINIRSKINYRNTIKYFSPLAFYDGELIKRTLDVTPLDIFGMLDGKIGSIELLKGGVLLKATNGLLDLEASNAFNEKMKEILGVTLPVGEPFR